MNAAVEYIVLPMIALIINCTVLLTTFPRRYSLRFCIAALTLFTVALYLYDFIAGAFGTIYGGLRGILYIPVIVWLLKGQYFQKVFGVLLQLIVTMLIAYLTAGIILLFVPAGSSAYYTALFFVTVTLYVAYVLLMRKIGRRFMQKLFESGRTAEWAIYSLGGLFSFVLFAVLRRISISPGIYILFLLFILWSFAILCYTIINTHEKTKQRYEAERREQKLSEEKALLESLNRTKSEFFGNISHEMKTPLTIIATDIQLAEQYVNEGKSENAKELIREAWQETMQTANLVTDALTLSRGQEISKPMEPFNYGAVIEATLAVFEPLAKKQGNSLVRDIAKTAQINGNADMLASALVNLLSNANRYTDGGVINVQWRADGECCRLTVSDNGSGIPPKIFPRVFERGVTDGSGTGLGLAIVKSITELHGGEVTAESEAGRGTMVTLMLPAAGTSEPLTEEHI